MIPAIGINLQKLDTRSHTLYASSCNGILQQRLNNFNSEYMVRLLHASGQAIACYMYGEVLVGWRYHRTVIPTLIWN